MKLAFPRKRHRLEDILSKSREADEALWRGKTLEDVAKSLSVSLMMLHRWRSEYGSADRYAVKRLKELEPENGRLKRLVADQALALDLERRGQEGIPSPALRRGLIQHVTVFLCISQRRARRTVSQTCRFLVFTQSRVRHLRTVHTCAKPTTHKLPERRRIALISKVFLSTFHCVRSHRR